MASKKDTLTIQEAFIDHLKQIVPSNISLADNISELLQISLDSAYRRLRSETEFTLTEIYVVCNHYRISVDSLFANQANAVTFDYTKFKPSVDEFSKYLTKLCNQLQQIKKVPQAKIFYAADKEPIFRSFHSDKLSAFKLFYWQRSVLNISHFQTEKFDFNAIPKAQLQLAKKLNQLYLQIPSVEIWTTETIQTSIKQVEYYFESGTFKHKNDAMIILNELKEMVKQTHYQAEHEIKDAIHKTPFTLYDSDLVISTNCIYIETNFQKFSFISFNSFNSLSTSNKPFCEEIEQWMKNLMKKSTLISGVAEKQRFQFFNKIYKSIDTSMERIKNY